jgi:Methyltransferase domain
LIELPYEDASYDHVWMTWFLEHVDDRVAALREARPWLQWRVCAGTRFRTIPRREQRHGGSRRPASGRASFRRAAV